MPTHEKGYYIIFLGNSSTDIIALHIRAKKFRIEQDQRKDHARGQRLAKPSFGNGLSLHVMDVIHYKVEVDHLYVTKAAYVVLGITVDGHKRLSRHMDRRARKQQILAERLQKLGRFGFVSVLYRRFVRDDAGHSGCVSQEPPAVHIPSCPSIKAADKGE